MKVRVRIGLWAVALGFAFAGTLRAEIDDLAADGVIGESSLFDSAGLAFGPATFAKSHGIALDRSVTPNRVYVSDTEHHRVLGWADADALANGAPADLVVGQADMTSFGCNRQAFDGGITPPATLSSLCQPTGLAADGYTSPTPATVACSSSTIRSPPIRSPITSSAPPDSAAA